MPIGRCVKQVLKKRLYKPCTRWKHLHHFSHLCLHDEEKLIQVNDIKVGGLGGRAYFVKHPQLLRIYE